MLSNSHVQWSMGTENHTQRKLSGNEMNVSIGKVIKNLYCMTHFVWLIRIIIVPVKVLLSRHDGLVGSAAQ